MDVTWTAADICVWNKAEQKCASTLPIVTIKVRAPQPAFTIVFNGQVLTPETVNAADGAVWYVFRAQITDASVMKLYSGITVLSKGEFFIMDQGNTKHWWEVANVIPWIYSSCSDAPDFGDTRLTGGVAEMGRFPGMNTSDVEHFLTLNGVPSADAHTWAIDTWFKLQFGEYAALPASFTAVQPPAR